MLSARDCEDSHRVNAKIPSVNNTHKLVDATIGAAVRDLRHSRGLSQSALAQRAGVDRKTINRIENGRHSTSVAILAAIAEVLNEKPSTIVAVLDPSVD